MAIRAAQSIMSAPRPDPAPQAPYLAVKQVCKAFGRFQALAGISCTQPAGVVQLWSKRRQGLSVAVGRIPQDESVRLLPITPGAWHSIDAVIKWSQGADGRVAVYFDGSKTPVIAGSGPNMHNAFHHYLKLGMYSAPELDARIATCLDCWLILENCFQASVLLDPYTHRKGTCSACQRFPGDISWFTASRLSG